jgi:hypothetical protein
MQKKKKKKLRGTRTECKIWDGLRCHDTHTNYNNDWFRHSNLIGEIHTDTPSNIKFLSQKFDRLPCWYYWREEFMINRWYGFMWHDCLPSFMKIFGGVQAILRFCLRNLRGCEVGITDGRDLRSASLRWDQVAWYTYTYRVSWRYLSNITVNTATIWETILLVSLIEGIYEVRIWDGFMWHDVHNKFYEDRYRRSSEIKVLF